MRTEKLFRFPKKGYIGGVCHGLGEHTGIDPILWRVVAFFWWFFTCISCIVDFPEKGRII